MPPHWPRRESPSPTLVGNFDRAEAEVPAASHPLLRPKSDVPNPPQAAPQLPEAVGRGPGDGTKEARGPASALAPRLPESPPPQPKPRPAPHPAPGRGSSGSPAGTRRIVSAAAAVLERPPRARAQFGRCSRPRPGLAPPPPFVDAGQAGAVGCAAAAPGPGSEAPGGEEAARSGPGPRVRRRPAEGLRRPRPARPSRALDRSVPVRGRGSCQKGSSARACRAGNQAPPSGATPGPGLLGCQAVPAGDSRPLGAWAVSCDSPPRPGPCLSRTPLEASVSALACQTLPCVPVLTSPSHPNPRGRRFTRG